jgi:hypothetical protein
MSPILIVFLVILFSIICSSIVWFYEAYSLNRIGMCVKDDSKRALLLCPLNQSLTSYLLNLKSPPYYDSNYELNFSDKYNKGYLSLFDFINTRFKGAEPPATKGNLVYCNKDYSLCEMDSSGNNGIVLTQNGVYTLKNADGTTGFYMDLNMLLEMSNKNYKTIQEFIKDIAVYQKQHNECLIFNSVIDKQTRNALSLLCNFFNSPTELIKTIKNTLLVRLSDSIINDYLVILKDKAKSKNMTTFEYFAYYAIISRLNNTSELILVK